MCRNHPLPTLAALALACVGLSSPARAQFAFGADVSWLPQSEALGVKYYDRAGKAGDAMVIMRDLGINAIRLRTWVHPNMNDAFSGHCSKAETIAMAVRAKKLGMRVMVDFHYHDTWTSVGTQETPATWVGKSYPAIKDSLAAYVTDFCKGMKAAGVDPEWFQNGNETNSGILVKPNPVGSMRYNPAQMAGLLNAGYDAIKTVFPKTKVVIHTAQPQKNEGAAMMDSLLKYGGKMDVVGFSSYANSGNVDALVAAVKNWHTKYGKEVMMVEIGSDKDGPNNKILIEKWNAGIEDMNKPCEGGTFYWEPEAYGRPGNWADAIFDATGKPEVAWDCLQGAAQEGLHDHRGDP